MKYRLLLTTALLLCACGQNNRRQSTETTLQKSHNSIINSSDVKSLNEIRFGNCTDEDWYDNYYFRFLRKCFDECLKGIENENTQQLQDYKSVLNNKFVIYNVESYIFGGLFITLGFLNKPEIAYQTIVYSDVDEKTGKITGYSLRGFNELEEKLNITKDDILQLMKEHPENQLW